MPEKKIVEVTIRVDESAGQKLERECARCGQRAKSTPLGYEAFDRETGAVRKDGIFFVRSTVPPDGWDRVLGPDGFHVDVCADCLRLFLRERVSS